MHNPLRGRWLPLTLAIVGLVALFVRLGFWQLDRLGQRREANAFLIARLEQPPLTLTGGPLDPATADLRRAVVQGEFDPDHEIVLRNQSYTELPGVHILTPLRIAGSDAAILVDRGWIPYDQSPKLAQFAPPAGEVQVGGILRRSRERTHPLTPADVPPAGGGPLEAWHRVDIPRIQGQTPYPLLPVYLEEERAADAIFNLPRPDPDIALDEGPHLAYAIQWFAFAIIVAVGYVFFYRSRRAA